MADLITPADFTPVSLVEAVRSAGFAIELFECDVPMPTVPAAARAIGVDESLILKTLLFQDPAGRLVRVIASGPDRIDRQRLQELAGTGRLALAPAGVVLEMTGWPPGGVAPIGSRMSIPTFVDERVLNFERVFGGGGTEWTLIGLAPADIVYITGATVVALNS